MHNEQISSSRAIPIAEREPVFPCWLHLRVTGWQYFRGSLWATMAANKDATTGSPTSPPPAGTEEKR